MNAYIISIVTVSLAGAIITSILPSGEKSLKKYVNYVIGIITVAVILSPLSSLAGGISSVKENIKKFSDSIVSEEKISGTKEIIINTAEKNICDKIKRMVMQKFNFSESDVYVTLEVDKSNSEAVAVKCINVILTGKASWSDADNVKKYIEKISGCDAYVTKK